MKSALFITGNQSKADYLSRQLGVTIPHRKVELDEIQSTNLHEIVEHKLIQAFDICGEPVLVEDVSLEFSSLNGLPGPYIKWFIDEAGPEACCRMLDGLPSRDAVIKCTFGYYDGKQMYYFDSASPGTIADRPRGENGFGFDKIFINEGYDITRAEMSQEENEKTYSEIMKPFKQVRDFFNG